MFPTVERTAFNYVIGPLVMSFNRVQGGCCAASTGGLPIEAIWSFYPKYA
jgi:hypothetical protein